MRDAGIPMEKEKLEKMKKLEAGVLEGLKACILREGMVIEQERLLAETDEKTADEKDEKVSKISFKNLRKYLTCAYESANLY